MSKVPRSNILMDIGVFLIQRDNSFVSWIGAQFFNFGFMISRIGSEEK